MHNKGHVYFITLIKKLCKGLTAKLHEFVFNAGIDSFFSKRLETAKKVLSNSI